MNKVFFAAVLCGLAFVSSLAMGESSAMNEIAKRYVNLVLALGQHDPDYVDAYYGPPEWKSAAEKEKKSPGGGRRRNDATAHDLGKDRSAGR